MDFSAFALLAVAGRALALAATIVMTGAVVFKWAVLARWPVAVRAPLHDWSARIARSGAAAAVCIIAVEPLRLYAQARGLVMAGDPVLPMIGNVMRTMWGRGWALQEVASLGVLVGLLMARRRSRAGWALAFVSVLGATLSPALMGHAIAAERFVIVSLLSDWIHVAMAGAWLGALAMLALVARSVTESAAGADAPMASLIELFHPIALACSAALIATGVVSLLLRVRHPGDLLHSEYGAVLAVKLALTLGVVGFGLHHSRRGARLVRLGQTRNVARSLAAETVLAGLVIAATAVLVGTSPPMRMATAAQTADQPDSLFSEAQPADGSSIALGDLMTRFSVRALAGDSIRLGEREPVTLLNVWRRGARVVARRWRTSRRYGTRLHRVASALWQSAWMAEMDCAWNALSKQST